MMKKTVFNSIIICLFLSFKILQAETHYVQVFFDDFNDGTNLNDNYFIVLFEDFRTKCACNDPNILVEDGYLKLRATYAPGTECNVDGSDGSPIVTHDVTVQEMHTKRKFKYGNFEILAKIDKKIGFTSAFWFYGNHRGAYEGYELDIFELEPQKSEEQAFSTYHLWDKDGQVYSSNGDYNVWGSRWDWTPDVFTKYEFDWFGDTRNVYVNSTNLKADLVLTLERWAERRLFYADVSDYPSYLESLTWMSTMFDGTGSIILNAGTNDGTNTGVGKMTDGYGEMAVDYLRVTYRLDTEHILDDLYRPAEDSLYASTVYTGKHISNPQDSPVIIKGTHKDYEDSRSVDFIATDEIIFRPGFHAEKNTNVRAWIVNLPADKSKRKFDRNNPDRYILYEREDRTEDLAVEQSVENLEFNHTVSSNNSESGLSDILLFPNPTNGLLTIKTGDQIINGTIKMINMVGSVVKVFHANELDNSLDISDLPNGQYYLVFNTDDQTIRKLICKN